MFLTKNRKRLAGEDYVYWRLCETVRTGQWYARTPLEELTAIRPGQVNDDRLYRGLDRLAGHMDELCEHLMRRYRDWFGVRFEFLLYDVTSTYLEGQALGHSKAARGYSRDQRSDCQQVCIGRVCTPDGLRLAYEVFAGNTPDVATVEDLVELMERKYGHAPTTTPTLAGPTALNRRGPARAPRPGHRQSRASHRTLAWALPRRRTPAARANQT